MTISISATPGQTISLILNTNDGYGPSFSVIQERIAVNTNGQINFTLSSVPSILSSVLMFVNGTMQTLSIDFSISSGNVVFINNNITLVTTDAVDFYYLISSINGNIENTFQENLPVTDDGQKEFTLTKIPLDPNSVLIFGNGVLQKQSIDYLIRTQDITFTNVTFSPPDIVSAYYALAEPVNDGYVPQIQSIFYPNSTPATGYPQSMTLVSNNIWKYSLTLPTLTTGTFIAIASYISTSSSFIQNEVFMINVSAANSGGFVSPG